MPKPESNLPVPEFVSQIVKDPNKHVEILLLSGFVGPSSEKEHTRLYFDPELSQYVEIPNKAILHSQQMGPETSPLGGVYVWIARDAQLVQGKAGTERAKAKFFEGPIAQGAAGGGAPELPITVPAPICTGVGPHCGGTQGPPCPTHIGTACPPCPTHVATGVRRALRILPRLAHLVRRISLHRVRRAPRTSARLVLPVRRMSLRHVRRVLLRCPRRTVVLPSRLRIVGLARMFKRPAWSVRRLRTADLAR